MCVGENAHGWCYVKVIWNGFKRMCKIIGWKRKDAFTIWASVWNEKLN